MRCSMYVYYQILGLFRVLCSVRVVRIHELVSKFVVSSSRFSVPSPFFFGVGPFILRYRVLEFDIYVHVLHVFVKVRSLRTV